MLTFVKLLPMTVFSATLAKKVSVCVHTRVYMKQTTLDALLDSALALQTVTPGTNMLTLSASKDCTDAPKMWRSMLVRLKVAHERFKGGIIKGPVEPASTDVPLSKAKSMYTVALPPPMDDVQLYASVHNSGNLYIRHSNRRPITTVTNWTVCEGVYMSWVSVAPTQETATTFKMCKSRVVLTVKCSDTQRREHTNERVRMACTVWKWVTNANQNTMWPDILKSCSSKLYGVKIDSVIEKWNHLCAWKSVEFGDPVAVNNEQIRPIITGTRVLLHNQVLTRTVGDGGGNQMERYAHTVIKEMPKDTTLYGVVVDGLLIVTWSSSQTIDGVLADLPVCWDYCVRPNEPLTTKTVGIHLATPQNADEAKDCHTAFECTGVIATETNVLFIPSDTMTLLGLPIGFTSTVVIETFLSNGLDTVRLDNTKNKNLFVNVDREKLFERIDTDVVVVDADAVVADADADAVVVADAVVADAVADKYKIVNRNRNYSLYTCCNDTQLVCDPLCSQAALVTKPYIPILVLFPTINSVDEFLEDSIRIAL